MFIIKKYIAREFLGFFLICSVSLIAIAVVFSALAELPSLEKENGVEIFVNAILSGIPLLIEVITPISVLLATVLAFISLSRTSETIAMMAAGVSLFNLVVPIIICGLGISFLLYLNQSYLAPQWGADERAGLVDSGKRAEIWRFHKDSIYYFSTPDKGEKSVPFAKSFLFNDQHEIEQVNHYSDLKERNGEWMIRHQKSIRPGKDALIQRVSESRLYPSESLPVVFTRDLVNPRYSSFSILVREIMVKRGSAVDYRAELFAFYQKIAGLIAVFVMILLALPFSIYSGRAANVRTGIVVSVVLGFIFWLVDQILVSLSNTGTIPIVVSAFGADLAFLLLATILIRLKRT
jgi:lipopolysaccharide export system permease protein